MCDLVDLILQYTRFDAARTLRSMEPSEMRTTQFGESVAILDPARKDSSYCNRVLGFKREDLSRLGDLLSLYASFGVNPQFDLDAENLCTEVEDVLLEQGFKPVESLAYLTAVPSRRRTGEIRVERWAHARVDAFRALLETSGVGCSEEIWRRKRDDYCTDTFRTHVAVIDGKPCAWGTLFVAKCAGHFANAYTQPDFRGRGCHDALLKARLDDSASMGLRWVATDVVPASSSERNCRRAGFQPATTHTLWRRS